MAVVITKVLVNTALKFWCSYRVDYTNLCLTQIFSKQRIRLYSVLIDQTQSYQWVLSLMSGRWLVFQLMSNKAQSFRIQPNSCPSRENIIPPKQRHWISRHWAPSNRKVTTPRVEPMRAWETRSMVFGDQSEPSNFWWPQEKGEYLAQLL